MKETNYLVKFFSAAPHAEPIQDSARVDQQYRYWRIRIFYSMYFGYVFYYFTRKSFTFAAAAMKMQLGFDEVQIGSIGTVFALAYGLSKFTCGILSDRSNPRYFMGFGLIATGLCNILFGFSTSITWLIIFWGMNGWFQGTGWPPSARLLTHWYSQSERGTWWGVWNTAHNVGGFLIPFVATVCANLFGWKYALYIPGLLSVSVGLILIDRLRDTPQSLGLPNIEKYRNDYPEGSSKADDNERELSTKEILFQFVLTNRYLWVLSFAYFFVYVLRQAANDWIFLYFVDVKEYSQMKAGACVSWFEVGGFFGCLFAGWGSDYFFKGRRAAMSAIYSSGMAVAIWALWLNKEPGIFLDSILIFMIGFLVFGPQMLIGMSAAELSHKKAAATATGFTGLFAYLGAAFAGMPLGMVIRDWGWESFYITLAVCGVISTLALLPLWFVRSNPHLPKSA
ncbi:Probable hexose phosphate transport protein [Chlamydiales bacterium SCGC AG-110-M15]|nr:Probable hexose phosphate transport protein [Chlamydiales bacterium SCGC AG-110-M15]